MSQEIFYILTSPAQLPQLRGIPCHPAHLAYRISPNLRLLRLQGAQHLRGGLMTVTDCPDLPRGDPGLFSMELLRECTFRGFRGVILDLEHPNHPLISILSRLESLLTRQGVTLFLPEPHALPASRVLISSALSGGSLSLRLTEAVQRFGPDRVVLAVEKTAEDFLLPAPTGRGTPLSPEQLHPHTTGPSFFSPTLCAQYTTYRDAQGHIHLILYDDLCTLSRKLQQARCAGVYRFLLPWCDISSCPEQFGLPSLSAQKAPKTT